MFSVVASALPTARGVTRITTGLRLRGREEGDDVGRRRIITIDWLIVRYKQIL